MVVRVWTFMMINFFHDKVANMLGKDETEDEMCGLERKTKKARLSHDNE